MLPQLAEIDALTGLPNIQEDISLITKSSYGADITWSENSDYLTVENGVLKVTKPETTAEAELTAKISYNDNEYDYVIKVKVLSQQDIDNTYDINPTPQNLVMNYAVIDFDNVKVFYETGITEVTKSRVNEIMEIQPWVYRLRDMAKIINYSLEAIHGDETNKFTNLMSAINLYNGIDTADIYKTESLEGQGTTQTISYYIVNPGYKNILPFVREIVTECNDSLFDEPKAPYVFTDTNTEGWELVKTNSSYSADAQVTLKPGSYVEYELMALQTIESISGLDTLKAQVSLDGKTWEDFESGATARYVRILNTTSGNVELNLNTIKVTLQTYGVSSITSSAEIYQPGTYPTKNIIDGNKTTFVWLNSQAVNTSLTMNFDSTRTINYVEFVTTTDGGRFVGKGKIEYLNEAGQWIVAGSINSDDFQDGATSITFEEVKAKGIRFVVTEAGSTNWLKVAEFNAAMADMTEAVNNLEEVEGAFKIGDVNHSGVVDIDDSTLIQRHLAKALGDAAFYKENADYSKDGKITVYDATLIQLMLAS